MVELAELDSRTEALLATLDRLEGASGQICENLTAGGEAAGNYPGLADLEEVRVSAEKIKQELAAVRQRGNLDPEVRELDRKLDDALRRYYWLWQQCKQNMG